MSATENELSDDQARATIAKLIAETAKINTETTWYPFVVAVGFLAGGSALTILISAALRATGIAP